MTAAPPMLSMLWGSDDPADVLSERFGFADAGSAADWLQDTLWDTWVIAVDDCDRLVMSASSVLAWITSGGRHLIVKWSVSPPLFQRLADTATLTMWLNARGIPVAAPIRAKDGRLRVEIDNVSLGVSPVIGGDLLDVGDPWHVTEAGHMLARLHEALAAYPRPVDGGKPTRGEQLVQNDFRSANILHDGTSITAVLDFEEATYRTRSRTSPTRRSCSALAITTGSRPASSPVKHSSPPTMTRRP
jgi:homoserine kinase type II